ncbi:MAG: CRISPR-associated endonuclease Cas2, partial [Armatimonadota bacterium]
MPVLVVVCYDVPDDARRTRIFKRMKGFGRPVQK